MSKKRNQPHEFTSPEEKAAAKKAAVLGAPEKTMSLPQIIAIAAGLAMLTGGMLFYAANTLVPQTSPAVASAPVKAAAVQPAQQPQAGQAVAQSAEVVSYPETMFLDKIAKFFTYQHGNLTIKYFIVKSSDGEIRAAFDACDVCWPAGKGYEQQGDEMVCRNCGRRFPTIKVNEVQGGCNPSPLNRAIKDGQVVLQVKEIQDGAKYFDFSQLSGS